MIDGSDITVRYSTEGYLTSSAATTTISFHFEGVPNLYDPDDYD